MTDSIALEERLKFMDLQRGRCGGALREMQPYIKEWLPDILTRFYEHIGQWPQVDRFFGTAEQKKHAGQKQFEHWMNIASGEFNDAYVQSVRRIGKVHAKLGLEPRWYIAGYAFIVSELAQKISTEFVSKGFGADKMAEKRALYLTALNKAAMLDMDFAISIYLEEIENTKREEMEALAGTFEQNVLGIVESVAAAATELETTAQTMARTAEHTSEKSTTVSAAAEEATANVSVVATAADQMGASVREIAQQVSHSTEIASKAVERAQTTNDTIESLARAAEKIGEVVNMISDIAEQTNLLALNATIESARAGEAGRGFAVVASEVKSLATQTAKATEDIAGQIQSMQNITAQSVEAIGEIRSTIDEMNEVSVAINAAVEEQAAATQEIARNTQEAATGTQDVSRNIIEVLEGANETGAASGNVVDAAGELGKQAETLRTQVEDFLRNIRAA
ncbi:MAG: chemotaxis protein [Robiginitomaculum sp.]|nr:MAG: chemotaxis protein [Robiginitomaculum sp.]